MRAVFRKEMRHFFHSLSGSLVIGIFIFLLGIFSLLFNFYYGYTEHEYVLSYMTVGLAFLLPVVTVELFASERRRGTDRFLRMLPLTVKDVFFGKYLSMVAVLGILCVPLALMPLILSLLGEVNLLSAYSAILAFFAFGNAMLSVYLFISVAVKKYLAAWLISYAVPVVLTVLGQLVEVVPSSVRDILSYLSVVGAYTTFIFGLFDLRVFIFYLSVSAVFLSLAFRGMQKEWAE